VVMVELANNLLQHAGGGHLYISYLAVVGALDISAVDHGKGMVNVERCLADGFSTGSTPGLGLGAIRRFATRFGAYSLPNRSTVITARMVERKPYPEISMICSAIDGEALSGDSWDVSDDGTTFLVADGLGHGMFAADASRIAVEIFHKSQGFAPGAVLEKMHSALRATRGAAAAIAHVDSARQRVQFAGIGNISCVISNATRTQSMVSHNGTLGHQMRRVQEFEYSYEPGDLLLMQSDGLTTHSRLGLPASLLSQPPFVVAPLIYSEQLRGRDDATILVNRLG
ncbi:MAG TPA: SpoIIE family protein phosphatase, partial [Acidobacteriaceae bacterium]|nr:SpoIIE family protein phosphatase [Acidobacteriaceae bacterium]